MQHQYHTHEKWISTPPQVTFHEYARDVSVNVSSVQLLQSSGGYKRDQKIYNGMTVKTVRFLQPSTGWDRSNWIPFILQTAHNSSSRGGWSCICVIINLYSDPEC